MYELSEAHVIYVFLIGSDHIVGSVNNFVYVSHKTNTK